MVIVLGIGVQMVGGVAAHLADGAQKSIGTALPAVMLILVSVVAPLALFKLLAFVDPGTPSGSSFRQGMGAVGGVQGLLSGGGSAARRWRLERRVDQRRQRPLRRRVQRRILHGRPVHQVHPRPARRPGTGRRRDGRRDGQSHLDGRQGRRDAHRPDQPGRGWPEHLRAGLLRDAQHQPERPERRGSRTAPTRRQRQRQPRRQWQWAAAVAVEVRLRRCRPLPHVHPLHVHPRTGCPCAAGQPGQGSAGPGGRQPAVPEVPGAVPRAGQPCRPSRDRNVPLSRARATNRSPSQEGPTS